MCLGRKEEELVDSSHSEESTGGVGSPLGLPEELLAKEVLFWSPFTKRTNKRDGCMA